MKRTEKLESTEVKKQKENPEAGWIRENKYSDAEAPFKLNFELNTRQIM